MLSNVTFLLFLVTFLIFSFVQKYVILMGKHIFLLLFPLSNQVRSTSIYRFVQSYHILGTLIVPVVTWNRFLHIFIIFPCSCYRPVSFSLLRQNVSRVILSRSCHLLSVLAEHLLMLLLYWHKQLFNLCYCYIKNYLVLRRYLAWCL